MKYIVTQKIKAFGLEKGDIFEKLFEIIENGKQHDYYSRRYKIGAQIVVPHFILSDHPDWFALVRSNGLHAFVDNENRADKPEEKHEQDWSKEAMESIAGVVSATKAFIQGNMTKSQREAVYDAHYAFLEKIAKKSQKGELHE
jgi:hypothetical protein